MFNHVKVFDLGAPVISSFVAWLAFMYYMIPLALLLQMAMGQISVSEIPQAVSKLSKLHWQEIVFIGINLLIFMSTTFGLHYCWKRLAFFTINPSGEWACRNSFYYPLHHIHPHQSRQVKSRLKSRFDTEINETVIYGDFQILMESAEPILFPYSGSPFTDGKPALFRELGYPEDFPLASDADGNLTTPPHIWTASGPVIPSASPPHDP